MDIGIGIFSVLNGNAPLIALLGQDPNGDIHIYEDAVPQRVTVDPYVRFFVDDITPNDTKNGASTIDDVFVKFQVFGKKADECRQISNAIRNALDRLAHGTYGGVSIQGVRFLGGRMLPEYADKVDRRTYESMYKFRHSRI